MKNLKLEVCCGDLRSVISASEGGADRIELCSSLETGGVTPSIGVIKRAVQLFQGPVNVLIRPRGGDFLYNDEERAVMAEDVKAAVEAGAAGIVIGGLREDGTIDMDLLRLMIDNSRGVPVTFHRAFDMCRNPRESLEAVIAAGCARVLTSGQGASASEGAGCLRELVTQSNGRIVILAGGGVNSGNVTDLVRLTGVQEVHASAKKLVMSEMMFRRDGVSMGSPDSDEYSVLTTDADEVRKIKEELKHFK